MNATLHPTAIPAIAPVLSPEDGLLVCDGGAGFLVLVSVARVAVLVPEPAVLPICTAKSGASNPLTGVVLVALPAELPPTAVRMSMGTM